MKKKNIVLLSALLFSVTAVAQTEVTAGVTRGKDYGVTYVLPKTEIELTVQVTKNTYTPGEFSKYADRYLRLNNVSPEPETYWTLDKIQTEVIGVPDKENVYFVKMKDKTVAPLIELSKDGIVYSINMPLGSGQKKVTPIQPKTANNASNLNPRNFLTEEILMANSTAKMAELVAKEIYSIRESKNALLRGETDNMPKDGAQLKLMLDNLTLQERALTEMFAGKVEVEEKTYNFRIVPKEMQNEVAFRFSKKLGVVANNDLAGEPIYITVTDLKTITIPAELPKKQVDGIAYNAPGRAKVTLSYHNEELYNAEIPITQFGVVEYLAPVLFNKNSTIKVLFNPDTGALVKVDKE
ncbi:DUF4831 family protein [Bacteroides oleiciplenus]|uniref:DUF4831 domain-containing protein n=2 Tax=Bacteroides oleiciplenus TaxID=626931 RepID=K9EKW0_9BACE|nr:DUF4831 family protein [Bacteroides oleiciplenus]EKU91592.1 hypothetical protein HMPREF9447_01306 [Bacteroides oleiciplenus YIT 12058]RGN30862.1 DUF4831 family protein [Bacteroides oleiciplenus]